MNSSIDQLQKIISEYSERLHQISEENFSSKPSSEKWSRKEELGHLIDSAHTNLRRFMVSQYEKNSKIIYDQTFRVEAGNYRLQSSSNLIVLWQSLNLQISEVLKKMPALFYSRSCDTGKEKIELHSLEWLAEDDVKHLKHHLHHILELEANPY